MRAAIALATLASLVSSCGPLAMFLAGLLWELPWVEILTWLKLDSPEEISRRTVGLFYSLDLGGVAIGALVLGGLIDLIGLGWSLGLCSVLLAASRARHLFGQVRQGEDETRQGRSVGRPCRCSGCPSPRPRPIGGAFPAPFSGTLDLSMQSTLEETDKHTVRLDIEVPPNEFARDLDRTYRKVAGQVRIPGFRKGKVPKQIIDARIGRDHVLHEFVDEFVPHYFYEAVREHELAPISDPQIDLDTDDLQDGQPLRFSATVEIRPRLTLLPEQYRGVHVEAPPTEPRELEIDEFIDRLRERFAELEVVSRPARKGDYVLADVRAYVNDREIPEATRVGFLSEVGSEELVPELDSELEDKRKGEILKFNAVLPERFGPGIAGTEVTFQVLIKEVKTKKLPQADDEFAQVASEFDTIDELRADVRTKLRSIKEQESRAAVRDLVLRRVVDSVDVDLPDRLVDEETERRVERSQERAQQAGATLEEVLEAQGWDELQFRSDARRHAIRALKADLVLEAVARREGLKVNEEDLDMAIRALAEDSGRDVKEVRRILQRTGRVTSLASDIIRDRAVDLLVEAADVTTEGTLTAPAAQQSDVAIDTKEGHDD